MADEDAPQAAITPGPDVGTNPLVSGPGGPAADAPPRPPHQDFDKPELPGLPR